MIWLVSTTPKQTDGQTDRQTDTDKIPLISRVCKDLREEIAGGMISKLLLFRDICCKAGPRVLGSVVSLLCDSSSLTNTSSCDSSSGTV